MKRTLYLLACFAGLVACAAPVTTSQNTITVDDNTLKITSGTLSKGRFVLVEHVEKVWDGDLSGGKEKWDARQNTLRSNARDEIQRVCGDWFFAMNKAPVYNMLDSDETMGGAAPALGVTVAMAAYLVAAAETKDTNVPASVYMEFSCQSDEK